AAKSAIKDVARISGLSLDESNRLTKMVPDRLSERVEKEYPFNPKLDELKPGFKAFEKEVVVDDPENRGQKLVVKKWFQKGLEEVNAKINLKNCFRLVPEFREELENGSELNKEVLKYALQLEGSIRQVGMHACATIIGRGDLTEYIPICLSADKATGRDLWTSQFDGHYIEDVGMLKMDFLGLITLQIIHKCLDYIKARHGIDIDIEAIPINDRETYELYGRGDTTCVFQFESTGMREWLQKLHPERFEDLIAMNALYRPGPMDYIPSFVARKLGNEVIEYDLPDMEEYLAETYGITVYQEQVMLLSRKLSNFTKGEADKLRKAMGKKQIAVMQELKEKFMTQGMGNGYPEKTLDKIWKDWEKFAEYAFNKSHATCYAWVSYQTGYLKAHYPAEFFAANLSVDISMDEIKKIMGDCRAHKIKILNPDVNESQAKFFVNHDGNIIFGLSGIKGFGDNITRAIIEERSTGGVFADIYDFVERMSGSVNKKALESLAYAGALDCFGLPRHVWFVENASGENFVDTLIRYGEYYRRGNEDQMSSLFGEMEEMKPERPQIPSCEGLVVNELDLLHKEKELVGMYLSAHPLDRYSFEMKHVVNTTLTDLPAAIADCAQKKTSARNIRIGGMITSTVTQQNKQGKDYSKTMLEDFDGSYELALFGTDHENFMQYLKPHVFLMIEGNIDLAWKPRNEDGKAKDIPYRFKVQNMMLMGNAAENFTRGIAIHLTTDMVSKEFNSRLEAILRKHAGKMPVNMFLHVPEKNWNIELVSKKYMVTISSELFDELEDLGVKAKAVDKRAV
ncbi:MAG: DNA polymerase III subunit alpha, partial [Bacteroidales bacterium]|nr:DNA polymerase III subunit alpha [Bacteroidales bacterium]